MAIAEPGGIDGISASVKCRMPRKLIVTTSNGSPMPDDTPAMLKSASTGPSIAAAALSIDAGSDRSISWNSSSCSAGRLQVQPDDLGAELGELARHFGADARAAAGDHRTAAVVAPEIVDLRHDSPTFLSAVGFLLSQPAPDLSFAAAASMPAFISSIARDISLAVNFSRPVGSPPNE